MIFDNFVRWLAETPGSIALHESLHAYSYVETAHVLGIMLFVGTIAMVDLRLLGVSFRQVPVSQMNAKILPWTLAGFVLMVATGLLLFYAIPVRTYYSVWFRVKLVVLVIAAINIWFFHKRVQRNQAEWDTAPRPPLGARVSAAISLSSWALVIVMGRFIAYNWFDCDRQLSAVMRTLTGCPTGGI